MLKILTVNLCATHPRPRRERLRAVADFVRGAGVDVILCQEGIRSCWAYNTIRQLANLLGYHHYSKSTFGWPVFWEFRVGIISRWPIDSVDSLNCEVPQKEWLDAIPLPWRRRAVAAAIEVLGQGLLTAVSVHLSSSPKAELDRAAQIRKVANWAGRLPKTVCMVIGGDFNTHQDNPAFLDNLYQYQTVGREPDYLCVAGGQVVKAYPVLTDYQVTDHAGGIVAEVDIVAEV